MREMLNMIYDKNHADICTLNIYLPEERDTLYPVFIYFHGGGMEGGSKDEIADLVNITSNGIALVSVEYRKYPQAKFPEFVEDTAKAVEFVKTYGETHNLFSDLYVGGSSAGGYLAMMVYFDRHYLNQYGILPEEIKGWVFDAGQPTVHFNVLRERGLDTRLARIDEAAPIYFIDHGMDQDKQSKLLFITADNDMPNRLEQTKLILKTMEQFNYDMSKVEFILMEGCGHCGYSIVNMVTDFILNQ
ncbi:MAG: hypothetical protein K0S47_3619 [Herbinix sp.]|jgi:poly(3-hydroxybutyrate) depolymerase|nr:hypothetical protein [Herbinix sp.]